MPLDTLTLTVTPRQVRIIQASVEPLVDAARSRALAETERQTKQLAEIIYRDCRTLLAQIKNLTSED